MYFVESIKKCFTKYVDFSGRSSRSEFWHFILFTLLVSICAAIIDTSGTVQKVFNIIILLPILAVSVRRLHDINESGLWLFIVFTIIGIILLIYWFVKKGDLKTNDFDEEQLKIQKYKKIGKLPKFIKFFIIPFFIVVSFYQVLQLIGIVPNAKVITGSELSNINRNKLIDKKIINKNDEILFFYSDGFFSILEGGELITEDKLISYGKNEDNIFDIWEMKIENIKDIELIEKGPFYGSTYKIIGNNQSEIENMYIFLPPSGYFAGEKFTNYLKNLIIK